MEPREANLSFSILKCCITSLIYSVDVGGSVELICMQKGFEPCHIRSVSSKRSVVLSQHPKRSQHWVRFYVPQRCRKYPTLGYILKSLTFDRWRWCILSCIGPCLVHVDAECTLSVPLSTAHLLSKCPVPHPKQISGNLAIHLTDWTYGYSYITPLEEGSVENKDSVWVLVGALRKLLYWI